MSACTGCGTQTDGKRTFEDEVCDRCVREMNGTVPWDADED